MVKIQWQDLTHTDKATLIKASTNLTIHFQMQKSSLSFIKKYMRTIYLNAHYISNSKKKCQTELVKKIIAISNIGKFEFNLG